jgi:hypothetical protein
VEIIPLNEPQELLDLIRLGFAVHVLEIDQFGDISMDVDMMTAADLGESKAEGFRTGYGFCEAGIFGIGQESLE